MGGYKYDLTYYYFADAIRLPHLKTSRQDFFQAKPEESFGGLLFFYPQKTVLKIERNGCIKKILHSEQGITFVQKRTIISEN
jgi:hypothetical protein